jgi:hypothetical protein
MSDKKRGAGPQYLVLRDQIALNIESGQLPSGGRLPSERKLQSDSGAARGTVRVKPGTPGLLVVRTSLSADGRVVEYDHEYWRHDAIRVHVDLKVQILQRAVHVRPFRAARILLTLLCFALQSNFGRLGRWMPGRSGVSARKRPFTCRLLRCGLPRMD